MLKQGFSDLFYKCNNFCSSYYFKLFFFLFKKILNTKTAIL